jgi:hypothetical protein
MIQNRAAKGFQNEIQAEEIFYESCIYGKMKGNLSLLPRRENIFQERKFMLMSVVHSIYYHLKGSDISFYSKMKTIRAVQTLMNMLRNII